MPLHARPALICSWLLFGACDASSPSEQALDGGALGSADSSDATGKASGAPPGASASTPSSVPELDGRGGGPSNGPCSPAPMPADSGPADPEATGSAGAGSSDPSAGSSSQGDIPFNDDETSASDAESEQSEPSAERDDAGSPITSDGAFESSAPGDAGRLQSEPSTTSAPNDGACPDSADPADPDYDALVLCDGPVGYWALDAQSQDEPDLSGNDHLGRYQGGQPATSTLPNGDSAADFDGQSQFLSIDSAPEFSIPTTGMLTWEAWIQPAVVDFMIDSNGYVDWMGKCAEYAPTCEWEARMYDASSDRCNRLSAYAFNPGADLGSGAYFEAECGSIQPRDWLHVVGQYTLLSQPEGCDDTEQYPGSIEIWVNGVNWNQASHGQTGCMSQYQIVPEANDSPINVGTMAGDAWFEGAIGKLAIYDYLLDAEQIAAHYRAMTGQAPSGSCNDGCTL